MTKKKVRRCLLAEPAAMAEADVEAAEELLPLQKGWGEQPQGVEPALQEGEGGAPGEGLGAAPHCL